ncbi:N-acetylaspartate synthetase [Podila humilis]|nr:N-acetylaspartate synthetase [Podila humilis]
MAVQVFDKSMIKIRPYNEDDRDQVLSILIAGFHPVGTRLFHHLSRKSSTALSILLKSTIIALLLNLAWIALSSKFFSVSTTTPSGGTTTDLISRFRMILEQQQYSNFLDRILVLFMKPSFLILWALTSVVVAIYTLAKLYRMAMGGNTSYIEGSLRDDLGDISSYYQTTDDLQSLPPCKKNRSQFWVACLASHPQLVLGCIALDDLAAHEKQLRKKHIAENRTGEFEKPKPEDSELRRMSVHSDYRRLGIGKLLLETLRQHAVDNGFKSVKLSTTVLQVEAIAGYRQFGFEEVAIVTIYSHFRIWIAALDLTKKQA